MDDKELLKMLLGEKLANLTEQQEPRTVRGREYPKTDYENLKEGEVSSKEEREKGNFFDLPFSDEKMVLTGGVNEEHKAHSKKGAYKYINEEGELNTIGNETLERLLGKDRYRRLMGERRNRGVDLAFKKAGKKGRLNSVTEGEVVSSGKVKGYGNSVTIKTNRTEEVDGKSYPVFAQYNHLDEIKVKKGDKIKIGDNVGSMGKTGATKQVHLDFRPYIELEGKQVDVSPKRFFKGLSSPELKKDRKDYVSKPVKETYEENKKPILNMVSKANDEEEAFQKTKYDDLSFKDAFEKAYREKGEGETFMYQGKPILLKRAEPKQDKLEKLETIKKQLKPVEDDMPTQEDMNFVPEEEKADIFEDFEPTEDPREMQLQRLINKGEDLVSKYDKFKDGGRKYEDGGMYGPSNEELMGKKKSFEELAREYASLTKSEDTPTPEEMNPVVEPEKEQFVESPMDKREEYESYKKGVNEGRKVASEPPKSEDEPMTMETLEQRYMDLMKASESERKTAAWASAATQIASMLDKFSARPVGIQPINFQAQDNTAAMKELLNIGKFKGLGQDNQQMTPAQRARLELSREKLKEAKEDRQRKKLQFDQSQELRKEKFERQKQEQDELSDKQLGEMSEYADAIRMFDDIENLKKGEEGKEGIDTGFFRNAASWARDTLGVEDLDRAELKQLLNNTLAKKVKLLSGTAASDKERAFLSVTLPSINDNDEQFVRKLERARKDVEAAMKLRADKIKKSQGKDVDSFLPKTEKTYTQKSLESAAKKYFGGDLEKAKEFYESKGYRGR